MAALCVVWPADYSLSMLDIGHGPASARGMVVNGTIKVPDLRTPNSSTCFQDARGLERESPEQILG